MTMQEPLVSYTPPTVAVLMEEVYQNLVRPQSQPEQALRRASGPIYKDVQQRLRRAGDLARKELNGVIRAALELDETTYSGFLAGQEEHYQAVRDAITGYLKHTGPVPHDKSGNDRSLAVKWLVKAVTQALLKQHSAANPTLPLTYPTLDRFLEGSHAPTQVTMQALRVFLRLDEQTYETILRLSRKNYLYGLERVRDKVEREWGLWKRRMKRGAGSVRNWDALEAFWDVTAVSPKAMRGLGCARPKEGEKKPPVAEKTTQGTMLKLTVAFRYDPVRAEGFLAMLDSGFYDLRDMLFCSCLYLKIFEPPRVNALLEPYAYNRADPSKPRFDNPYQQAFGAGAEK